MDKSSRYLSGETIDYLRSAIENGSGSEVFCHGRTGGDGLVEDIKVLARGSDIAAPAIINNLSPGDVVIHNHPSGNLKPSQPDIELASFLGNQNIGFYIVSNDAAQLYPVVKPLEPKEIIPLDPDDLAGYLKEGGQIACSLPGFEFRASQVDLMSMVVEGFNKNRIIVAEGATGIGKSMAYLIPSLQWALQNEERILVSTNTINLQEQLIKKDIPFLREALAFDFKAVLVKGRGNYLCKRKMTAEEAELKQLKILDSEVDEIRDLIKWGKKTTDGSLSDLNIIPSNSVWEKLNCDTDTCLRLKCPFYHDCFLVNARREAAGAHLLIVNHHLLFADLSLRSNLGNFSDINILPPYGRVILDEAHHIEDVATTYFGSKITKNGLVQLLGRLHNVSRSGRVKGALASLSHAIIKHHKKISKPAIKEISASLNYKLVDKKDELAACVKEVFGAIEEVVMSLSDKKGPAQIRIEDDRLYSHIRWQGEVLERIKNLVSKIKEFCEEMKSARKNVKNMETETGIDLTDQLLAFDSARNRLMRAGETLHDIFFSEEQGQVKWIDVSEGKRGTFVSASSVPLRVTDILVENLYSEFRTVILTSATLAVNGEFHFLKQRLGLNEVAGKEVREKIFPSPFNYEKQVIMAIPTDMPYPNDYNFANSIKIPILESVKASSGRAFILFTSYYLLNQMFRELKEPFEDMGITSMRQGEAYRLHLLERFKKDKSSVLFATDSFWEGVDVEGDALESVIITKLPFRVPTDPVIKARCEEIESNGGDSFYEYSLPLAVLKFKQGFGRLVRKKTDRGSVVILDKRIIQKQYGKIFLNSLPKCTTLISPMSQIKGRLSAFFEKEIANKY